MANFSVEWLSQSFYSRTQSDALLSNSDMVEFTAESSRSQQQYPPSSPNNSCGYTSGSESEVGDDSEQQKQLQQQQKQLQQLQQQQRRIRTKFTSEQIGKLETTFDRHRYLGATQRRKLAEKLSLSETQVKTWFQNRRMKVKRELQDLHPDLLPVPAALLPPALFQHHGLSGQLPGFYPRPVAQPPHPPHLPHQHRTVLHPHFY